MKRPTPAAWKRLLAQYEDVFNVFLPYLTEEEKTKLFEAHDVLRLRASGAKAVEVISDAGTR